MKLPEKYNKDNQNNKIKNKNILTQEPNLPTKKIGTILIIAYGITWWLAIFILYIIICDSLLSHLKIYEHKQDFFQTNKTEIYD